MITVPGFLCLAPINVVVSLLDAHKDECTFETVHCEYYDHFGCDVTMLPKGKKDYNEQKHLSMALSNLMSLEEELKL